MRIYLAFSAYAGDGITCDATEYAGRGGSSPFERFVEDSQDGWITAKNAVVGRDIDPVVPGARDIRVRLDRVAFYEITTQ